MSPAPRARANRARTPSVVLCGAAGSSRWSHSHPDPVCCARLFRRQENVEVMLANIDKTEVLENKSAALADQAKTFHKTARATRKHMCMQNAKMNVLIGCICLTVLLVIILSVGGNMGWFNGGDSPSPSPTPAASSPPPPSPPSTPASGRLLQQLLNHM